MKMISVGILTLLGSSKIGAKPSTLSGALFFFELDFGRRKSVIKNILNRHKNYI